MADQRRRVTCPRCQRPDLLVNDDGSVRAHRVVAARRGGVLYLGDTCRDPRTRKAHTPGQFPTKEDVVPTTPRLFRLHRDVDVTGASGTGHVADGVLWPDSTVTVKWRGEYASEVSWPKGMEAVERIHGHGGNTRIVWADEVDRG